MVCGKIRILIWEIRVQGGRAEFPGPAEEVLQRRKIGEDVFYVARVVDVFEAVVCAGKYYLPVAHRQQGISHRIERPLIIE